MNFRPALVAPGCQQLVVEGERSSVFCDNKCTIYLCYLINVLAAVGLGPGHRAAKMGNFIVCAGQAEAHEQKAKVTAGTKFPRAVGVPKCGR